jgi:hypothetical protein
MTLEDLQPGASVRGILPDGMVAVVSVAWHGSDALTLIYRQPNGKITDSGKVRVERLISKSAARKIEVGKCFLWSSKFKTLLDPTYQPSERDIKRPLRIYRGNHLQAGLI